ncbi:DNA polymerase III subunit gamma/tau [Candidatus Legionella polyplacis]|uniref:DNA polymerase III subunit gamma/tau n=1 Tax=Candidatus Legionella polyplacis TaxID=2005262 RepID=A0ABZ2GYL9_9GAMM
MNYITLAIKWRPRSFSELKGQESTVHILCNSILNNRIHHSYIFSGERGIGKTSIARIFSKSLNCVKGITIDPCQKCDICKNIDNGCFIDLIEIDGASKTKVEDIKDILDNVYCLPCQGRFRIYLIDEVHMLSQHSFNALLKILEEPPSHVKFLLATTNLQKIPCTVLSRCLHFELQPFSIELIKEHLKFVMENEKFFYEEKALCFLAKLSKGSMRDALNLLDKSINICKNNYLSLDNIKYFIKIGKKNYALKILECLANNEIKSLILIMEDAVKNNSCYSYILEKILIYLHKITILQFFPKWKCIQNFHLSFNKSIQLIANKIPSQYVQLLYRICLKHYKDIDFAPIPSIGFEMIIFRMLNIQQKFIKNN